jgi:hypothetical protein
MKHAGSQSLEMLSALLGNIRSKSGLMERKPVVFYRTSKAFLHFHEDRAGLFMDVRNGEEWIRLPVTSHEQCLMEIDRILASR